MSTKLIALDMDGTLLNRNGHISEENKQAILEASKRGIQVVIATGRAYKDAKRVLDQANLSLPIIGVNGASITLEDGKKLSGTPLSTQTARDITTYLKQQQVYFEIYTNVDTYSSNEEHACILREINELDATDIEIPRDHLEYLVDQQKQQARITYLQSYDTLFRDPQIELYKILSFTFHRQKLEEIREYLKNMDILAVSASATYNIEITNVHAQKGNGLHKLANHYDIPISQTMAIGDNYNDLSMFKVAGTSVAMGNADDAIKHACTHTTLSNDENGVAHAIHTLLA